MRATINKLYTGCGHHNISFGKIVVRKFSTWWLNGNVKKRKAVYKEVDGLNGFQTSPMLFTHSASYLDNSITSVLNSAYDNEHYELTKSIRRNAHDFAVFRSAYFTEKLKDKTKSERTAILDEYERQLKVEGDMAARSSRSALQWQEYERTKDVYPNLEYLESRSVDKRSSHQKLYGIIKPINDPFWDDYLPPNGWNCKCRVRKTDEDITTSKPPKVSTAKGIAGNTGKQKRIFTKNHPFISSVSDKGKAQLKLQFEALKSKIDYGKPDLKMRNGSTVNVHLYADDSDLSRNFDAATTIGENINNTEIKITPTVSLSKVKNPAYLINGKVADLKLQKGKGLKNNISNAVAQGCEIVVLRIDESYPYSLARLKQQVNGALKIRDGQIKQVLILDKDGAVSIFKP